MFPTPHGSVLKIYLKFVEIAGDGSVVVCLITSLKVSSLRPSHVKLAIWNVGEGALHFSAPSAVIAETEQT